MSLKRAGQEWHEVAGTNQTIQEPIVSKGVCGRVEMVAVSTWNTASQSVERKRWTALLHWSWLCKQPLMFELLTITKEQLLRVVWARRCYHQLLQSCPKPSPKTSCSQIIAVRAFCWAPFFAAQCSRIAGMSWFRRPQCRLTVANSALQDQCLYCNGLTHFVLIPSLTVYDQRIHP